MLIKSVEQFRTLAKAGACGNTPRIWDKIEDVPADWPGYVFISSHTYDNFRWYHAGPATRRMLLEEAKKNNGWVRHAMRPIRARIKDLFCMECPDPIRQEIYWAFQFDWIANERHLIWAISNQPWGHVKRTKNYNMLDGIQAENLLNSQLQEHREDLRELEKEYPGSIVEATLFGWKLGIYDRKLLIWEVRHY